MKKRLILVVATLVSLLFLTQTALAAYDSAQTKATMRQAAQTMKELNDKVAAKDYYGAAENFMDIAKLFKGLESAAPPACDQAQWIRIIEGMINSAFKGIGACGLKNDAGIKQAIADMVKFRDEGHQMFIPKK
jgi:hypothetical protein